MFVRLYERRQAVSAVLADHSATSRNLPSTHWQIIYDIIPVLQALKCATRVLGAENNVNIIVNVIKIIVNIASDQLPVKKHLLVPEDDTSLVR